MFLRFFILCAFYSIAFLSSAQRIQKSNTINKTGGAEIKVKVNPLKNVTLYLGSYYGKSRVLVDSIVLNSQSEGVFKKAGFYSGGIYFLVSPDKFILQEFIMDDRQVFSISGDTSKKEMFTFLGSEENTLFLQYTQKSASLAQQLQQIETAFQNAKTDLEKAALRRDFFRVDSALKGYRFSFIEKYPKTILSSFLKSMARPEPPIETLSTNNNDSLVVFHFMKNHFWDNVLFNDERLLRTPFFEAKIDDFFSQFVSPDADSIIPQIKYMLLSAKGTKEMYPYLLMKFTNKYIQPEYMGQDKVFVFLFNEFYLKGDTSILNTASRKTVLDRGYSLIANQIGLSAPLLRLLKKEGGRFILNDLVAPYTFISFWDPNCGHCKETIPQVDSIYQVSWKNFGVVLVGVNVDEGSLSEWNKFIDEKELNNWVHVYQSKQEKETEFKQGIPNYRQLYDIRSTPTFYLLDKEKKIIAKQLSLEQFDQIIKNKSK